MVRRLDDMEEQIHRLGRMSPFAAVNFIRYGMEYEGYLKEYARYHKIREEELLEVADELQESAKNFKPIFSGLPIWKSTKGRWRRRKCRTRRRTRSPCPRFTDPRDWSLTRCLYWT